MITLTNGTQTMAKGIGFACPFPSLPITYVLYVPISPFNLISISKLIHDLNCSITFSHSYVTLQDRRTEINDWHRTIGRGREFGRGRESGRGCESGGLNILEIEVPMPVACSRVVTPFESHCLLGHSSLSLLKKLYPRLSNLSSLNRESCQYAKHHRVHLSPKVNK